MGYYKATFILKNGKQHYLEGNLRNIKNKVKTFKKAHEEDILDYVVHELKIVDLEKETEGD